MNKKKFYMGLFPHSVPSPASLHNSHQYNDLILRKREKWTVTKQSYSKKEKKRKKEKYKFPVQVKKRNSPLS
jgi:hypothetical protein